MLLYVDLIDACHLKCPTCARGVRALPNTSKTLPLDRFRAIVARAKADGAYRVDAFSWSEPFLCPNLHEYAEVVKRAGLPFGISTTLSLRRIPHFEATLRNTDLLTISVSGFDQAVYGINHRGGRIAYVKANLETLTRLRRLGLTRVEATLRLLLFDYNLGEEPKLRAYAQQLGIGFEVLLADGHPTQAPQSRDAEREVLEHLRRSGSERPPEQPATVCPLIFEHVSVGPAGDVYQCSAHGNYGAMKIGSFLELTREEILLRRFGNPVCNSCSWARRTATPVERVLLHQALAARLGDRVMSRVPALSRPLVSQPRTPAGHLIPKSRACQSHADPGGASDHGLPSRSEPAPATELAHDSRTTKERTVRDLAARWSDEEYLILMLESVNRPRFAGIRLPGFPSEEIQKQFVGSTGEAALREGYGFYRTVKRYCGSLGVPLGSSTRILDFGCGWGRVTRFFFKDVDGSNLIGVDVDPDLVSFCSCQMTCGQYVTVAAEPPMSFLGDDSRDVVIAYSVFSHLAEAVALKWMAEFARVLRPGGVLLATTQGRFFLDSCESLHRRTDHLEFAWHRALKDAFQPIEKAKRDYDRGRFLFSPTGGGGPRDKSFYGEAVIPAAYIERVYTAFLALRDFVDDPPTQALFVMQKAP